jgi:Bacterial regulatory helix-turn-helix protein, lysR family
MEPRHLRYFLAVGEASNFTKAAARLRVAQPALSRQVQDLEDEIGVELMRRSPRGVSAAFLLQPASNHVSRWNATPLVRASLKWKPDTASHCAYRF